MHAKLCATPTALRAQYEHKAPIKQSHLFLLTPSSEQLHFTPARFCSLQMYLGIFKYGPGDGNALLLPSRQLHPLLASVRLVPVHSPACAAGHAGLAFTMAKTRFGCLVLAAAPSVNQQQQAQGRTSTRAVPGCSNCPTACTSLICKLPLAIGHAVCLLLCTSSH